jgi:flagellar hook-basal body complex protein FliE
VGLSFLLKEVVVVEKMSLSPVRGLYEQYKSGMLAPEEDSGISFTSVLKDSLKKLQQSQVEADAAIQGFLNGQISDVHKVMLTMQKADITLRLALQLRNKALQAYEEIMRMQV